MNRAGRPTGYKGKAISKSITLDSDLLEQLEKISNGNLSQTINEMLRRELDTQRDLYHIDRWAHFMGVDPDPELDAEIDKRVDKFLDEVHERAERRRARRRLQELEQIQKLHKRA